MEQEITKFEQKYMLVTFKGTNIEISQKQENALKQQPANKLITLNGKTINTSDIAEILPLQDFYLQNPDKRPATELKIFTAPEKVPYTKAKRLRALESMLKGINNCNNGAELTLKQKAIKDKILLAIENTKKLNENDVSEFNVKSFM